MGGINGGAGLWGIVGLSLGRVIALLMIGTLQRILKVLLYEIYSLSFLEAHERVRLDIMRQLSLLLQMRGSFSNISYASYMQAYGLLLQSRCRLL